ncbi:response regulator transcription factor [Clostridium sp. LY3-2]|uniref:response regulator transcription factor n=1 Tax=Clostridium sp. LY3-2 TaxID=2942482 RepID=UPI002152B468|nr:response regulator transcription factor [Clostridium sp. LY3-2]MCR6513972.1 response regulator transcription factor [Clostridium sp. LY3-2]
MAKILLVEDDVTLGMGIEYTLKNEGFEVINKKSLKEARESLLDNINLILLDITLPDGNGFDFCKEIRKELDTPIIFLTACDEEANIVLGLDLGGDDYLTKPIRIRELIARINAVLRRREKKKLDNRIIRFGDISINPLRCEVKKLGEKINLTSGEYKLLLYFGENIGQVLSRKQLLENIWDIEGDFIEEKTLTVYIKRLREKLGEKNYIQTIRGLGYKLNK